MQVNDTNLKYIQLLTPGGVDVGRLYYLPAAMVARCRTRQLNVLYSRFEKALSELAARASIHPDGSGEDEASAQIIAEAERRVCELLDYACGVETAPEAFRNYKPFTAMSNGKFWAEYVMAALNKALSNIRR